jgi:transposase-like protein
MHAGVCEQTMRKRLAAAGVRIRSGGRPGLLTGADVLTELAAAYRAGATLRELAERYGVSDGTVLHRLQELGVERRPGSVVLALDVEAIRDAYRGGESMDAIAKHHGVSTAAVRERLLRSGEPIRPVGVAPALPDVDDIHAALAEAYAGGASLGDLARETGVSVGAVRRRLLAAGVPMRPAGGQSAVPDLPEIVSALREAHRTGTSFRRLAADLGVNRRRLALLLRSAPGADHPDSTSATGAGDAEGAAPPSQGTPAPRRTRRKPERAGERDLPLSEPERSRLPRTPDVVEALVEAWRAGSSIRELADEVGTSQREVRALLRGAGIDTASGPGRR